VFVLEIGPHPTDEKSLALTPKWHLPMGKSLVASKEWSGVASSPVYADGVVYFGGLDRALYAVRE